MEQLLNVLMMKDYALDLDHPIVQAEYSNTFMSYLNLIMSIVFLIWHPISLLFIFSVSDNLDWNTTSWALVLYILPIYSILMSIANEKLQVYMLYAVHYVQGTLQAFFIINAIMWMLTQWFWIESVEMDEDRNDFGKTARDL
jgi:hypothetical protein